MSDRTYDFVTATEFGSDLEGPIKELLTKIQTGEISGYALLYVEPHPTQIGSVVRERMRGNMSPRDMVMAVGKMHDELVDRAVQQQEDADATLPPPRPPLKAV